MSEKTLAGSALAKLATGLKIYGFWAAPLVLTAAMLSWTSSLDYPILEAATPDYQRQGYAFCAQLSHEFSALQRVNTCIAWSLLLATIIVAILGSSLGPSTSTDHPIFPTWVLKIRGVLLTSVARCLALLSHFYFSRAEAASIGAEVTQLSLPKRPQLGDSATFFSCVEARAQWEVAKRDANTYARHILESRLEKDSKAAVTEEQVRNTEQKQSQAAAQLEGASSVPENAAEARQQAAALSTTGGNERVVAAQRSVSQAKEATTKADRAAAAAETGAKAAAEAVQVAGVRQLADMEAVRRRATSASEQAEVARTRVAAGRVAVATAETLLAAAVRQPSAEAFAAVAVKVKESSKLAETAFQAAQGASTAADEAVALVSSGAVKETRP